MHLPQPASKNMSRQPFDHLPRWTQICIGQVFPRQPALKPVDIVLQGPLSSVAFAVAREAAELDTDLLLATGMFLSYVIFLSLAYRETCRVKRMGIYPGSRIYLPSTESKAMESAPLGNMKFKDTSKLTISALYFSGANVTNVSFKVRISGYNLSTFGPLEQHQLIKDLMNATAGIHKVCHSVQLPGIHTGRDTITL